MSKLKNNFENVDQALFKFIALLELIINLKEKELEVVAGVKIVNIPVYNTIEVREIVDQALDLIEDLQKNPDSKAKKYNN